MSKEQSARRLHSAGGPADPAALRETFSALIQEAQNQRRHGNPGRSASAAFASSKASLFSAGRSPMLPENLQSLLRETDPQRRLKDLVLPRLVSNEIREFVEEVSQIALLRAHSLEPRHTVMLVGPPGTGKTSLASAIATELALPFLTVRYDGLVGSYLGETASRLQQIVEYVSRTPCVLFFDEFDSVGKERSDEHETGEIKRVVSSLLLYMDALPAHCVVICATNHPELLDRAVWRRFEVRVELPKPGEAELRDWFMRTEASFGGLGITAQQFVKMFSGETFSEIEAVVLDARRKVVLAQGSKTSVAAFSEAIARWERRRHVGGATEVGRRTNRKNKPRAGKADEDAGTPPSVPVEDLLSGTSRTAR